MSFLTVGGHVIPVSGDSGTINVEETGDRQRMFDASMLETVRARKQVIACVTPASTRANAEIYKGWLLASPPIACSGDLFNNVSTNCFVKYEGMTPVPASGGVKWRVRFTLYEA